MVDMEESCAELLEIMPPFAARAIWWMLLQMPPEGPECMDWMGAKGKYLACEENWKLRANC